MKYLKLLIVFIVITVVSCDKSHPKDGLYADIITEKGTIIAQLHFDGTPLTVANFVSLSEGTNPQVADSLLGKKFYNGLPFHRVVPDFMIQGGDIKRSGKGNPGFTFEDEFPRSSLGNLIYTHDSKGILSMANSGPNSNGSQFFITHQEATWLDGKHTVFGKVVKGLDIIDSIQQGDQILEVKIVRKGSEAKNFDPMMVVEKARILKIEKDKELAIKRTKDSIQFAISMNEKEALVRESGLKVLRLNKGKGKKVAYGDKIKVHYTGHLVDGSVFDSSHKRNKPFEFTLGVDRVIEGWTEGVELLHVGEKAVLFIPYDLAYGEKGHGPIPAKSKLIFEVEIIEIIK